MENLSQNLYSGIPSHQKESRHERRRSRWTPYTTDEIIRTPAARPRWTKTSYAGCYLFLIIPVPDRLPLHRFRGSIA